MTSAQRPVDVRADAVSTLLVPDGPRVPVPTQFGYRRGDPYAVHICFDTGEKGRVVWTFARELLTEGMRQPTGLGDVHLSPVRGPAGTARLRLGLSSPTGAATFELPRHEVARFLSATWTLVPPGTETDQLNLDAELASVLASNT